ncbi:MAG TPA: glycosyltransferase family A protein, partial [Ornithinimicrobium sp.]|uniref:glycosyltransferase family 2 protein n=1 Tax=Ornithinimicrobium sp. TaxID=1977084 RepID=UPI002B47EF8B
MRHSSSRTTPEQVARLYAGIARAQDPDAIVATALRTKSRHAREVLAELAWPGHVPTDIHAWAQAGPAEMPSDMDAPWLGRFAQVVALQEIEDHAFSLGRAVFEQIDATGRLADLPPHLVELFLQLRLATRDRRATESLLAHPGVREPQRHAIAADLLNPHIFDAPESEAEWLEAFNRALGNPSIADVCLRPDTDGNERTTFDRLSATSMPTIDSGRLITVLMSCFRPGPELFTAIRSVCQQTWSNWELLLIDDASGASYAPVFDEAAAMDNRIRVIRKALNGGTYRARNTGLRQARGEFCTVVDADDWIHPQAFERHVAPLIERAGLPGTISRAVKVNQHLELNRPGTAARVASAASLMFRTVPVVSRIGFFDPTGKGADTEFRKRIELVFGRRVREIPDVLSVLR